MYRILKDEKRVQISYEYGPIEGLNAVSEHSMNRFFNAYEYPDKLYVELKKISEYCRSENIELKFIILPVYKLVDERIKSLGLFEMKQKFKDDLNNIADVLDYSGYNNVAEVRDNFMDYFHPKQHVIDDITVEIWGGNQ